MPNIDNNLAINPNKILDNEKINAERITQQNTFKPKETSPAERKKYLDIILRRIVGKESPPDDLLETTENKIKRIIELDSPYHPLDTNDKAEYKKIIESSFTKAPKDLPKENIVKKEIRELCEQLDINHIKQDVNNINNKMKDIESEINKEKALATTSTKKGNIKEKVQNFTKKIRSKTTFLDKLIALRAKKLQSPIRSIENNPDNFYRFRFALNSKRNFAFEK